MELRSDVTPSAGFSSAPGYPRPILIAVGALAFGGILELVALLWVLLTYRPWQGTGGIGLYAVLVTLAATVLFGYVVPALAAARRQAIVALGALFGLLFVATVVAVAESGAAGLAALVPLAAVVAALALLDRPVARGWFER